MESGADELPGQTLEADLLASDEVLTVRPNPSALGQWVVCFGDRPVWWSMGIIPGPDPRDGREACEWVVRLIEAWRGACRGQAGT